ncbi:hypothetical protein U1Q18_027136 [Sarracenia purpurea var. burkii]
MLVGVSLICHVEVCKSLGFPRATHAHGMLLTLGGLVVGCEPSISCGSMPSLGFPRVAHAHGMLLAPGALASRYAHEFVSYKAYIGIAVTFAQFKASRLKLTRRVVVDEHYDSG